MQQSKILGLQRNHLCLRFALHQFLWHQNAIKYRLKIVISEHLIYALPCNHWLLFISQIKSKHINKGIDSVIRYYIIYLVFTVIIFNNVVYDWDLIR